MSLRLAAKCYATLPNSRFVWIWFWISHTWNTLVDEWCYIIQNRFFFFWVRERKCRAAVLRSNDLARGYVLDIFLVGLDINEFTTCVDKNHSVRLIQTSFPIRRHRHDCRCNHYIYIRSHNHRLLLRKPAPRTPNKNNYNSHLPVRPIQIQIVKDVPRRFTWCDLTMNDKYVF